MNKQTFKIKFGMYDECIVAGYFSADEFIEKVIEHDKAHQDQELLSFLQDELSLDLLYDSSVDGDLDDFDYDEVINLCDIINCNSVEVY